jgi:hypothetical protein
MQQPAIRYLSISLIMALLSGTTPAIAQTKVKSVSAPKFHFSKEDSVELRAKEDSLTALGVKLVDEPDVSNRFQADSQFTRTLVRALKTPYSFEYPFDSLQNISHLYSPDSTFRLFTWEITIDEDNYRRHGAIQMRMPDGSLKLFVLIDRTPEMTRALDTVTNNTYWVGNIYYRIVEKKYNGKKYYTLLGYDEHTFLSTRKWIEVLTFDEEGKPVFGGNYFSFPATDPDKPAGPISRFMIEYKKDGRARLQYDDDLGLIIYDHLVSESNDQGKPATFIPDGDYEGFRWVNGKWVHIEKVFNFKLMDGQAPVPNPIKPNPKGGPGSN